MILKKLFLLLFTDQSGAIGLEYVLVGSIVSIAVITGALTIGGTLNDTFAAIALHL